MANTKTNRTTTNQLILADDTEMSFGTPADGSFLQRSGTSIAGGFPGDILKEWGSAQNAGNSTQRYLPQNITTTSPSTSLPIGAYLAPVNITVTTVYATIETALTTDSQDFELFVEDSIGAGTYTASGLKATIAANTKSASATGSIAVAAGLKYLMGYKQSGTEAAGNKIVRAALAARLT